MVAVDANVCAELVDALLSWSDEVWALIGGTREARGWDMAGKSLLEVHQQVRN
jgi:hypothetical protein